MCEVECKYAAYTHDIAVVECEEGYSSYFHACGNQSARDINKVCSV